MKTYVKIFFISFVLIGITISFGYWAKNSFEDSVDMIISLNDNKLQQASASNVFVTPKVATSSIVATTTSGEIKTASSSQSINVEKPFLDIKFPTNNITLYTGCTYDITWNSTTTIKTLGLVLVDSGTKMNTGPGTSGIKSTITGDDIDHYSWRVGTPWPGRYFILARNINGTTTQIKSWGFFINAMPAGLSSKEKQNICTIVD